MERILKEISEGKYLHEPPRKTLIPGWSELLKEPPKQSDMDKKKAWYKIGKVIWRGHKPKLHKESQIGARRTYEYYSIRKGDWAGPSCRQFSKMSKYKYQIELALRGEEFEERNSSLNRGNLEEGNLSQDHVNSYENITGAGTQSMGLGMDWVTELDADPPTADADPPTADADPPTADAVTPFADIFSQLD
jgi:hypothetical protein